MSKVLIFGAFVLAGIGSVVSAQSQSVPEGCEAFVTIHRENCMVSNYLQCGAATEVHSYENGKLTDSHYFGPDWDLVRYQADGGRNDAQVVEGSAPEASLTQALTSGESLGTRELTFSTGVLKGNAVQLDSELRMGNEVVEISGETFRVGTLVRNMTVKKNGITSKWSFTVLASSDASLFIEGEVDVEQFGKVQTLAWNPTLILRSGAPGFMSTEALPGCDG